ncbi:MAG: hypothetical protein H7A46_24075 [Verrucomicrobiales bacterium]|nr:hypothetical protein [Verrucomicrobiales bacterium]
MRRRRSPRRLRRTSLAGLVLLLLLSLGYAFSPAKAVWSVRELSNPAKLATLGKRGANPRLNKIVYWLWEARERGLPPETTALTAQALNGVFGDRARLVAESLARNVAIADELGLYTRENRERLRHGGAAIVTQGPHAGQQAEVDHVVPVSLAPEIGNELANLELLPEELNRQKSDRVGPRELDHALALHRAGLLSTESLEMVRQAAD